MNQMGSRKTKDAAVARVTKRARAARALRMRMSGASHQQIADTLNFRDNHNVAKVITAELDRHTQEPATHVRALHLARLDVLLLSRWQRAISGDDRAFDQVHSILKDRAKLTGMYDEDYIRITVAPADPTTPLSTPMDSPLLGSTTDLQRYMKLLAPPTIEGEIVTATTRTIDPGLKKRADLIRKTELSGNGSNGSNGSNGNGSKPKRKRRKP